MTSHCCRASTKRSRSRQCRPRRETASITAASRRGATAGRRRTVSLSTAQRRTPAAVAQGSARWTCRAWRHPLNRPLAATTRTRRELPGIECRPFPVRAGMRYTLSAWIKAARPGTRVTLRFFEMGRRRRRPALQPQRATGHGGRHHRLGPLSGQRHCDAQPVGGLCRPDCAGGNGLARRRTDRRRGGDRLSACPGDRSRDRDTNALVPSGRARRGDGPRGECRAAGKLPAELHARRPLVAAGRHGVANGNAGCGRAGQFHAKAARHVSRAHAPRRLACDGRSLVWRISPIATASCGPTRCSARTSRQSCRSRPTRCWRPRQWGRAGCGCTISATSATGTSSNAGRAASCGATPRSTICGVGAS